MIIKSLALLALALGMFAPVPTPSPAPLAIAIPTYCPAQCGCKMSRTVSLNNLGCVAIDSVAVPWLDADGCCSDEVLEACPDNPVTCKKSFTSDRWRFQAGCCNGGQMIVDGDWDTLGSFNGTYPSGTWSAYSPGGTIELDCGSPDALLSTEVVCWLGPGFPTILEFSWKCTVTCDNCVELE